jgi:hypothetical protein
MVSKRRWYRARRRAWPAASGGHVGGRGGQRDDGSSLDGAMVSKAVGADAVDMSGVHCDYPLLHPGG